jgi:hypothetical protein
MQHTKGEHGMPETNEKLGIEWFLSTAWKYIMLFICNNVDKLSGPPVCACAVYTSVGSFISFINQPVLNLVGASKWHIPMLHFKQCVKISFEKSNSKMKQRLVFHFSLFEVKSIGKLPSPCGNFECSVSQLIICLLPAFFLDAGCYLTICVESFDSMWKFLNIE